MSQRDNDTCPFLVPVMADRLFVYPIRAFCHPPGERVRIPADATIEHVCTRRPRACPGYQVATAVAID